MSRFNSLKVTDVVRETADAVSVTFEVPATLKQDYAYKQGQYLTLKLTIDGDSARGWNYAFNIRWDPEADRFWIARLSANEWKFRRDGDAWRVVRCTNINLDGDERPRALFRNSTGGL